MSFSDVTRGQGSFVSRTKKIERDGSLKRIRVISGSRDIYE